MQIKITRNPNYIATEAPTNKDMQHAKMHKYVKRENVNGRWRYYYDYNNGEGDKAGVEISKNKSGGTRVQAFNTKMDGYWEKHNKTSKKKYGPVTVEKAEDGLGVSIDIPSKQQAKKVIKKYAEAGKKKFQKLFGIH